MSTTLKEANAPMDDLTATRLCAEAMEAAGGIEMRRSESGELVTMAGHPYYWTQWKAWSPYDPMHDDAHAMALVKKFRLDVQQSAVWSAEAKDNVPAWFVGTTALWGEAADLNRAIVFCVAQMQAAKS